MTGELFVKLCIVSFLNFRVRMHTDKNNLIRDQRYLFRSYPTCFCGQEVVSWLVKTQRAPERFIAVALMNILLDHNIIHQGNESLAYYICCHI